MSVPTDIAIVGCGLSGTSAFTQLVDRYPVKTITIFEASGRFGPGYPYQPDESGAYLLNNTTDTMGVVPGQQRAFLAWLRRRHGDDPDPRGYVPRSLFGEFLEDVFASTCARAKAKGIDVRQYPVEVLDIRETESSVVLVSIVGSVSADVAILTTGRCVERDVVDDSAANSSARYFTTHVMNEALDDLADDATVHILGASLSAYDVVNRLFSSQSGCAFERNACGTLEFRPGRNARRVFLCSRSGRLKAVQSRQSAPLVRRHFTLTALRSAAVAGTLSLAAIGAWIRDDAAVQGVDLDWREIAEPYRGCSTPDSVNERATATLERAISVTETKENFLVDLFEDAKFEIWDAFAEQLLPVTDELTFRREYETAAMCYAAPCPKITAEKLLALLRSGRLNIVKGVRDVYSRAGGAIGIVHDFGTEEASVMINATSSTDREVASTRQPELFRNLAARGLLNGYRRDGFPLLGAAVDMETYRAIGSRRLYLANMFLWGPGSHTSSALTMCTVVSRLLRAVYPVAG